MPNQLDCYRRAKSVGRCVRCSQMCDRPDRVCCAKCRTRDADRLRDPGACIHCKQSALHRKRGLCLTCYRKDDIRHSYAPEQVTKPLDPSRVPCRHCEERNGLATKRGLCSRCHGVDSIRAMYRKRRGKPSEDLGPTMEELEKLIAEQMPTMPKESRYVSGPVLPQVVSRGRGVRCGGQRIEV